MKRSRNLPIAARVTSIVSLTCTLATVTLSPTQAQMRPASVVIPGHISPAIAASRPIGRVEASMPIQLAITLRLKDEAGLGNLLQRLYDPNDPLYGQYLTTNEFTALFCPTEADYNDLIIFARANGLTVVATHPNRMVLDVSGTAADVERAFQTRLLYMITPGGRQFRAPSTEPTLPSAIAEHVTGIIGLDTFTIWARNSKRRTGPTPRVLKTGPLGMSPADIRAAYNLNGINADGSGQVLGLFELDGYQASDVISYENQFNLRHVPLQNVLIDGASGGSGDGADEVTADIDFQVAIAPGSAKILVYESPGPRNIPGVVDTYNRIANDNLVSVLSASWGVGEPGPTPTLLNSENAIFRQMAAQGQSVFAASGDYGAYDGSTKLRVKDPASQPYVTGVGGTKVATRPDGTWISETTWNSGVEAGGGGVSAGWPLPGYQLGVVSLGSGGSTTMRNVPDVSLNSDPNKAYAFFFQGHWTPGFYGTSCAAPLWSAFAALVNQSRIASGKGVIGFANPLLYLIGKGSHYNSDFHDIADNSNNHYFHAVAGYDMATGWGSFNGLNLFSDMVNLVADGATLRIRHNYPGRHDACSEPGIHQESWRMRNTGTSSLGAGYKWTFDGGDKMSGPDSVSVPEVTPGITWDQSVILKGPALPGTYQGY